MILKPKQFPRFGNDRKLALAGFTFQDKLLSKFCADPEIICHGRALSHPGENLKASIFLPTLIYIYLDIPQQEAPPNPLHFHTQTQLYLLLGRSSSERGPVLASKEAQARRAGSTPEVLGPSLGGGRQASCEPGDLTSSFFPEVPAHITVIRSPRKSRSGLRAVLKLLGGKGR